MSFKSLFLKGLLIVACIFNGVVYAQTNLNKVVSISVKQKKLADLLAEISKKGNFYFSYSRETFHADSLVTVNAGNKTVGQLLDQLFGNRIDYKETQGYIILRATPNRLSLVPNDAEGPDNILIISGYVIDEVTGKRLANASIFEKRLLVSTLSDQNGAFKLKLKADGPVSLTVSKEYYRDTTVNFLGNINISGNPRTYAYDPALPGSKTEHNWLGRMFISSRSRIQSLNIGGFISGVPVQTSFLPGLGSHGLLSGQIVNKFSLNALGGYSGGVNGAEIGGLFNLNKQDAMYVQVAGLFNAVGGRSAGVQVAGLGNKVYKDVSGVQVSGIVNNNNGSIGGAQVAGIANINSQSAKGFQVAGILNKNGDDMHGFQVAGIANINNAAAKDHQLADTLDKNAEDMHGFQVAGIVNVSPGSVAGFQVAGIANITSQKFSGFQVAGILNRAHVLNGTNIALINVADTINGCAIDLFSLSKNGYHQLLVYADDNLTTTLAFKTGNDKLYAKLIGGVNFTNADTYFTYGIGLGHNYKLPKNMLLSNEFSAQFLDAPHWNNLHQLYRISALLTIPVTEKVGVFFGPSLNLYDADRNNTLPEESAVVKNKIALTSIGNNFKAWVGWSVGVSLF